MNDKNEIGFLKLLREGILAGAIIPRGMEGSPQYCAQFAKVYSSQITKAISRFEALELLDQKAADLDSQRTCS